MKVQYPGVDEAIRADLTTSDLLFRAMSLMFPGLETGAPRRRAARPAVEELDYAHEAENQQLFADYYAGHPFIRIPRVVDELSTNRVLTTELAHGARFDEVEQWSQEERDLAAETIFRFVFRSLYRLHAFNGDPHPGNYLFSGDGIVTFLDFGLVKRYEPDGGRAVRGTDPHDGVGTRHRAVPRRRSKRTTSCGAARRSGTTTSVSTSGTSTSSSWTIASSR